MSLHPEVEKTLNVKSLAPGPGSPQEMAEGGIETLRALWMHATPLTGASERIDHAVAFVEIINEIRAEGREDGIAAAHLDQQYFPDYYGYGEQG